MTSAHGMEMEGRGNGVWMEEGTTRANVLRPVVQIAYATMRLFQVADTAT